MAVPTASHTSYILISYMLRSRCCPFSLPCAQDGDFSEERFRNIVNANLANDVGNLLNRTLNLLKKNCGGALPLAAADIPADHPLRCGGPVGGGRADGAAAGAPFSPIPLALTSGRKRASLLLLVAACLHQRPWTRCSRRSRALAAEKVPAVQRGYDSLRFDRACEAALSISSRGNQFLEETAPWTAFKKVRRHCLPRCSSILPASGRQACRQEGCPRLFTPPACMQPSLSTPKPP